jgi:hypothetical protein
MLGMIALDRIASNDPLREQEEFSSEDVFGAGGKVLGSNLIATNYCMKSWK